MQTTARRGGRTLVALAIAQAATALSGEAIAQVVAAEPVARIEPRAPEGAPSMEVQVTVQLVVDPAGQVESAVVTSRAPADAPSLFDEAALTAVRNASFRPSTRDGRPLRARVEYVVVFRSPKPLSSPPAVSPAPRDSSPAPAGAASTNEQDEDYVQVVQVRGAGWPSPRGVGDLRIKRELLDAAPHQQTSEMLSAAPGFFVDHEDTEGLGNDVYLRGFDLEHGSGIEMRVGNVPINVPLHIQGQGYADANFIVPEVVRTIRVLGGPYDPRQGDAAIVGSAYFDLGVPDRGYQLKATYGSFDQVRLLAIAAPPGTDDETFAAFAYRKTDGFGENRAAESATANAQMGVDIGAHDHVRLLATAYGARAALAGVVRRDDVEAGRIGFYDTYPNHGGGQGVQSARVILGADFDHRTDHGGRLEFAPWVMWTDFRARQNYTGNIDSSQIDPAFAGLGDLFETTNVETAGGVTARFHAPTLRLGNWGEIVAEPGIVLRAGHTDQAQNLLEPESLQPWDRRVVAALETLDVGGYADIDLRVLRRLRISGGVRADLLDVSIDDRLANVSPASGASPGALAGAVRDAEGVAAGPRVTAEVDVAPGITPVVSYGEGFRSLDASRLGEGASPYSKVRSFEVGVRAQARGGDSARLTSSVAFFETWVRNELVFEAQDGGLQTENASLRRGLVASLTARPFDWLLASSALSLTDATFTTQVIGVSHFVPNIPAVLFRADATAHGTLATVAGRTLTGRAGVGYTLLGRRHLTDTITGPTEHVLNATAALRYAVVELGLDVFNVLGLQYADDEAFYVSNWSVHSGPQLASPARHILAAPPRSVLASVRIDF